MTNSAATVNSSPFTYTSEGDRYDGGLVVYVYVNGVKVAGQILDGGEDYKYNGYTFSNVVTFLTAIGEDKGNGATAADFIKV